MRPYRSATLESDSCHVGSPFVKLGEVREISAKEHRINEEIRASEVRLIGEDGKQVGIMHVRDALQIAEERGLDLVEVSPTASPPVCRLMDYGKFIYEKAKRERQSKKAQRAAEIKEIRLRPKIGEHDIAFKVKLIRKFLSTGSKVKVRVRFRGREVTYPEIGRNLLTDIANQLEDIAVVEQSPRMEGYSMLMILAPLSK